MSNPAPLETLIAELRQYAQVARQIADRAGQGALQPGASYGDAALLRAVSLSAASLAQDLTRL